MKFIIYRGKKKEWRWKLVAKNGKIIADSAEGYKRVGSCRKLVYAIKIAAMWADVKDDE